MFCSSYFIVCIKFVERWVHRSHKQGQKYKWAATGAFTCHHNSSADISNQLIVADRSTRGNQPSSLRLLAPTVLSKLKITCCALVDNWSSAWRYDAKCTLFIYSIRLTFSGRLPHLLVTSRVLSTCDGQKCSLCPRVKACANLPGITWVLFKLPEVIFLGIFTFWNKTTTLLVSVLFFWRKKAFFFFFSALVAWKRYLCHDSHRTSKTSWTG